MGRQRKAMFLLKQSVGVQMDQEGIHHELLYKLMSLHEPLPEAIYTHILICLRTQSSRIMCG
jgi:hypothetical protein